NESNGEMDSGSSMENVSSGRNLYALISVLLAMLLHKTSESDHNKREAEKMKKEAELLKEDIRQMKKEKVEERKKGPSIDDKKENERMINGSYQHNQDSLLPPLFDTENPFFEICGVRINLSGYNHPDSENIQHSLPEGLGHFDNLRREGMNFDKKIIIGDTTIDVHKELLSARIPYFKNLFSSNWREISSDLINLSFGSIIDNLSD
ncbi:hypothetical protein PRIPAC_70458, partial [Pristionchus pacificus]